MSVFRSYNDAAVVYGQTSTGDDQQTLLPRQKFQFSVSISHLQASGGGSVLTTLELPRISSIDMPSYSSNTTTVNQFNKKKLVQTGITYDPITLTAYDTRDGDQTGSIEQFLREYFTYYYAGTFNADAERFTQNHDLLNFTLDNSGAGYKLQQKKYFINSITVTRKHLDGESPGNQIIYYNPIISAVQGDTLDYSDSGPVQYRITFSYEAINIISGSAGTENSIIRGDALSPLEDLANGLATGMTNVGVAIGQAAGAAAAQAVESTVRRSLNREERTRLNELKRSKNALDAVLEREGLGSVAAVAAQQRYEAAYANSRDLFQSSPPDAQSNADNAQDFFDR